MSLILTSIISKVQQFFTLTFSIWFWKCFFRWYLAPASFWHCLFLLFLTKFATIIPVRWLGMMLWSSLCKCNNVLVASCTMPGVCFGGEARFVHAPSPCVCVIIAWHMMLHMGRLLCDAVRRLGYCKSLGCAFYLLHVKMFMGWGGVCVTWLPMAGCLLNYVISIAEQRYPPPKFLLLVRLEYYH